MAQTEDFVTNTGSTYRSTDTDTESGRGSEAIRSDIDRTRANMDETFAALDAKLTPSQLLLEGWNLFRGGSTAGASKLWRVAKEHPMPAAVIGLGLGWLLVESSRNEEDSRRGFRGDYGYGRGTYGGSYGYTGSTGYASGSTGYATGGYAGADYDYDEESGGRLSAVKEKVKDVAENAKDAVTGAVSGAGHKVGDAAGWTKEHALDLGHRTKDQAYALRGKAKTQVRRARVGFWQTMEENPLMVGAATLALGVIAGLAIPSTRKEDEWMGETRDRLMEEVKETGQQVMEKGKHVAEAVVDKVKDEAQSQGLTPETVVGNVAEKVKTVAREATNTAKEEAKRQNLTPEALKTQGQTTGGQGTPAVAHEHEPELIKR